MGDRGSETESHVPNTCWSPDSNPSPSKSTSTFELGFCSKVIRFAAHSFKRSRLSAQRKAGSRQYRLAVAPPNLGGLGSCLLGYDRFPGVFQPRFLFQGQTLRRPFSTRSKCLTPKAKGCSRPISEWDPWGRAWVLPASPPTSARPAPTLLSSLCSVKEMLTTQAERFSKEEVTEPSGRPLHPSPLPGAASPPFLKRSCPHAGREPAAAPTEFHSLSHPVRPERV